MTESNLFDEAWLDEPARPIPGDQPLALVLDDPGPLPASAVEPEVPADPDPLPEDYLPADEAEAIIEAVIEAADDAEPAASPLFSRGTPADEGLFGKEMVEHLPTAFLRAKFLEPPLTLIRRDGGNFQNNDRAWKRLGIESEVGRADKLAFTNQIKRNADDADLAGTSIFSPTLAQLLLQWYSLPGDVVLDPFAGGSVRGIVSARLGRQYTGIELRPEQVAANRKQIHVACDAESDGGHVDHPDWIEGDSWDIIDRLPPKYRADFILTCPPYAHLEKYSDDPRDLSNMPYEDFLEKYREIIAKVVARMHDNRFIAWAVGDVRERGFGPLHGLPADTVVAFRDAGAKLYNDHIVATPMGTAPMRASFQFPRSRKVVRNHDYAYVFIKGDPKIAADRLAAGTSDDGIMR